MAPNKKNLYKYGIIPRISEKKCREAIRERHQGHDRRIPNFLFFILYLFMYLFIYVFICLFIFYFNPTFVNNYRASALKDELLIWQTKISECPMIKFNVTESAENHAPWWRFDHIVAATKSGVSPWPDQAYCALRCSAPTQRHVSRAAHGRRTKNGLRHIQQWITAATNGDGELQCRTCIAVKHKPS